MEKGLNEKIEGSERRLAEQLIQHSRSESLRVEASLIKEVQKVAAALGDVRAVERAAVEGLPVAMAAAWDAAAKDAAAKVAEAAAKQGDEISAAVTKGVGGSGTSLPSLFCFPLSRPLVLCLECNS